MEELWENFYRKNIMNYSYEQGKIDGDITQAKFLENNPSWVDLNKKVKEKYRGADFWLPTELRGNILYGPKLELKGRNCDKVDPYKKQMEDSDILAVEFDGDGEYHLWYMKDFLEQSKPHSDPGARETGRRQMTRKKYLEGEIKMSLDEIVNTIDPSQFVRDPRPATLDAFL